MIRLKYTLARLTIAATVAAILAGSQLTSAFAREKIIAFDSLSLACLGLQQESDALIAEYGRPGTTLQRKEEIIYRLKQLGFTWDQIGCRAAYGQFMEAPLPSPVNTAPVDVPSRRP